MNDYTEVRLDCEPCNETITDIAASMLADAGYESFVPDATGLTAYIPASQFSGDAVADIVATFPIPGVKMSFTDTYVEGQDWNAEWEKNYFQPITVGGECVIHSSFHKDIPPCRYDIVIDPKMAFGTGHHATTSLIIRRLLDLNLDGLAVMDMGTGTGILAILAAMRGASVVDAVEIDEFAFTNAVENVALNGHPEIKVSLGDASLLPRVPTYDLFIANINRNVILGDMPRYAASVKSGGGMILSGFYVDDVELIEAEAALHGLVTVNHSELNRWCSLMLMKR